MNKLLPLIVVMMLQTGCAFVLPIIGSLAAEGVSVSTTGNTISENIKEVIEDLKEPKEDVVVVVKKRTPAPLPPRKPTFKKKEKFELTTPAGKIGEFYTGE